MRRNMEKAGLAKVLPVAWRTEKEPEPENHAPAQAQKFAMGLLKDVRHHRKVPPLGDLTGGQGDMKSSTSAEVRRKKKSHMNMITREELEEAAHVPDELQTKFDTFWIWLDTKFSVIDPLSPKKLWWDTFVGAVLITCIIVTPYQICFMRQDMRPFSVLETFNLTFDIIFMIDFVVTFNTGLLAGGDIIRHRTIIAHDYLKSWATIDLLASIPFTHLFLLFKERNPLLSAVKLTRVLKMLKFSRLLKVFKLVKLMNEVNHWDDDPSQQIISDAKHIFGLISMVMLTAHFSACAFAFLADGDQRRGWPEQSWVSHYFNAGQALSRDDDAADFPTPFRLYVVAMYWAFTTLTTVGYGDVLPRSNGEMVLTALIQFCGTCTLGYVMGDVTSLMTREDASALAIKERIATVNAYMKHRGLPRALKAQIRSHYTYMWERNSIWDEAEILAELPQFLRSQVVLHCNRACIEGMPFLMDIETQALAALCCNFVAMQVAPAARVIAEQEMGHDFYVVQTGKLVSTIRINDRLATTMDIEPDMIFRRLGEGDFFAEYALLNSQSCKHPYTVTSIHWAELLLLSYESYITVAEEFPVLEERLQSIAEARFLETHELLKTSHSLTAIKLPAKPVVEAPLRATHRSSVSRSSVMAMMSWKSSSTERLLFDATSSSPSLPLNPDDEHAARALRRSNRGGSRDSFENPLLTPTRGSRDSGRDSDSGSLEEFLKTRAERLASMTSLPELPDYDAVTSKLKHDHLLKTILWSKRAEMRTLNQEHTSAHPLVANGQSGAVANNNHNNNNTSPETPQETPRGLPPLLDLVASPRKSARHGSDHSGADSRGNSQSPANSPPITNHRSTLGGAGGGGGHPPRRLGGGTGNGTYNFPPAGDHQLGQPRSLAEAMASLSSMGGTMNANAQSSPLGSRLAGSVSNPRTPRILSMARIPSNSGLMQRAPSNSGLGGGGGGGGESARRREEEHDPMAGVFPATLPLSERRVNFPAAEEKDEGGNGNNNNNNNNNNHSAEGRRPRGGPMIRKARSATGLTIQQTALMGATLPAMDTEGYEGDPPPVDAATLHNSLRRLEDRIVRRISRELQEIITRTNQCRANKALADKASKLTNQLSRARRSG